MPVDDDEPLPHDFAVGHDGKIVGIYRPQDQRREPAFLQTPEGPLELQERAPVRDRDPLPPEPERPEPRRGPPLGVFLIAGAVVLALFLAAGLLRRHRTDPGAAAPPALEAEAAPAPVVEERAAAAKPVATEGALTVESEPPEATVFLGSEEVGKTPYLGSNGFPRGKKVTVRIVLEHYRVWVGTLVGGADTKIKARLQRE